MAEHLAKPPTIVYKKNSITIKFDGETETQDIVFHTPNDEAMTEYLTGLNEELKAIGAEPKDFTTYRHKPAPPNWGDLLEYKDQPTFAPTNDILKCAEVEVKFGLSERRLPLYEALCKRFKFKITEKTTNLWVGGRPPELSPMLGKMWVCDADITNKYPIYIISIGRWAKRSTQRYCEWSGLNYKVVVEPREYAEYAKVIPPEKLLVCPEDFSLTKKNGSTPVRNFVWETSIKNGEQKHWILDDNITSYKRCDMGDRTLVKGGVAFRALEDFCDRFGNIKMAGHNYTMFGIPSNTKLKPIVYNSRIYSSILLSNDLLTEGILAEGWRGKWNEDTDLSLRILKLNYPTALFNTFLAEKVRTMAQKGGNTDTLYNLPDCHLQKASFLVEEHPELCRVNYRFSRVHHYVNYKPFKHLKPIYREGEREKLTGQPNNYGLKSVARDWDWNGAKPNSRQRRELTEN